MPSPPAALFQPFPMRPKARAQVWRHQPAYRRPRHFHAEPEVNLVAAGSATLAMGDNEFTLEAGDFLLFQPAQDHELVSASADLRLFVFALRPELGDKLTRATPCAKLPARLAPDELTKLTDMLAGLGEVADAGVTETWVGDLFEQLQKRVASADALSRRAVAQLRAEPAIAGAALARRLHASPSALSRRFRHDVGVRLVDYRARLRLIEFVRLVDSGRSLSDAALSADFGSYAQCHRFFRRALGCAPQNYFGGVRRAVDELVEPGVRCEPNE